MNRIFIVLLILPIILISGCISNQGPVDPVNPDNIEVTDIEILIPDYQEGVASMYLCNNEDKPIEFVEVISFGNFTVGQRGTINLPGKKDEPSEVYLYFKIRPSKHKIISNTTDLNISYASGRDDNGDPIFQTKIIPIKTIPYKPVVLPVAELQSVGFVKDMQHLLNPPMEQWELKKGENTSISFYVKNNGQTTIDENVLVVRYTVENERIGSCRNFTIDQAMARNGRSYTNGLSVPVKKDAPNGETDVVVSLLYGDKVIDSEVLTLIVIL